ncbi:MAG: 16S rRNA (uracil(1498)-N(3))-methyltransferase [Pseudomonadota bacterium]
MPRFHCPVSLSVGSTLTLPAGAARHVQVLRLQPDDTITLFNGEGGECEATVTRMGRSEVEVHIVSHTAVEREAPRAVHLALGVPANERMDWLVEKAAELGAASLQPLQTERSVLRLSGERAEKKRKHWQAIAVAACEQCGRNRVPPVPDLQALTTWLDKGELPHQRLLLSLQADSLPLAQQVARLDGGPVVFLSGPEGGLSPAEEQVARAAGFVPVSLGPRTLRAETAPLAALATLTL